MGFDKSTRTIISSHFTHPGHTLRLVDLDTDFECDGCNGPGHGRRYRCSACTGKNIFDLHERCATCPSSFSTSLHPGHPLILSVSQGKLGPCVLCGDVIEGLHYACSSGLAKGCSFNIHPICTELPASVHHALHPNHLLTLQPSSTTVTCMACSSPCYDRWRYQCTACGVDIHLECAFRQSPPQTHKVAMGHPAPSSCHNYKAATPQPPPPSQVYYHQGQGCFYAMPAGISNPYTPYYNTYQQTPYYYTYYYQPAAGQVAPNYTYYYQLSGQQYGGTSSSTSSGSNGNGLLNRKRIMSILGLIALKVAISAATGGIC